MLIKLAALGGLGYLGYRYYEKNIAPQQDRKLSYAGTDTRDTWDKVDADPVSASQPASTTSLGTTTGTTGNY